MSRKLEIQGSVYWSDGTAHGKCEQCRETAYHFDENGSALCEECLIENHLNGKYSDGDDDFGGVVDEENEVLEDHNRSCPYCGGEFWDGGTSCTCDDDDTYYEDFGEEDDDNVFRASHEEFNPPQ